LSSISAPSPTRWDGWRESVPGRHRSWPPRRRRHARPARSSALPGWIRRRASHRRRRTHLTQAAGRPGGSETRRRTPATIRASAGRAAPDADCAAPFDGNVANIAWGGTLSPSPGADDGHRLRGSSKRPSDRQGHAPAGGRRQGPVDLVVSFFKREPVLVRFGHRVSLPGPEASAMSRILDVEDGPDTGLSGGHGNRSRADDQVSISENTFRFSTGRGAVRQSG